MTVHLRALGVILVLLVAAGCSGDDATGAADDSAGGSSSEVALAESLSGDAEATDAVAPTTTEQGPYELQEQIPGEIRSQYELVVGQCFDTVELQVGDGIEERWTVLSCDTPHEFEVFHLDTFPAGQDEPYPGEELFDEWSRQRCYDAFAGYVGQIYELSQYRFGFIRPNEANFTHPVARYRKLQCYLIGPGGDPTVGSAAGTGV